MQKSAHVKLITMLDTGMALESFSKGEAALASAARKRKCSAVPLISNFGGTSVRDRLQKVQCIDKFRPFAGVLN